MLGKRKSNLLWHWVNQLCRREFLVRIPVFLAVIHFAVNSTNSFAQNTQTLTPWRPQVYFGTVNFNEQFTVREEWLQTAASVDGMLLHVHFFVRHLTTPDNKAVDNAVDTIKRMAPNLAGKSNLIELTYHIQNSASSPNGIARVHAKNIADIEKLGIPIAGVNVDWILSGISVQMVETPRHDGETDDVYFERILSGVITKSRRYVTTFRAEGRKEKLYAVFPPLYLDEGRWKNARNEIRPGITASRLLEGLFDAGFDGFTADSPYYVMANPAYKSAGYFEALRSIERTCRQRKKSFGFIVTGNNEETGAAYDAQFAKTTLDALEMVKEAGLRPDQIISESWYKGPFTLVPETRPGTYTHTVRQIVQRLQQQDRQQKP